MRRIKMVLAVAAAMGVMATAAVAPAMAADNNNNSDRHLDRQDVRLDRQLLNHDSYDDGYYNYYNYYYNSSDNFCPFWGDTSGIVNQWDCSDCPKESYSN